MLIDSRNLILDNGESHSLPDPTTTLPAECRCHGQLCLTKGRTPHLLCGSDPPDCCCLLANVFCITSPGSLPPSVTSLSSAHPRSSADELDKEYDSDGVVGDTKGLNNIEPPHLQRGSSQGEPPSDQGGVQSITSSPPTVASSPMPTCHQAIVHSKNSSAIAAADNQE